VKLVDANVLIYAVNADAPKHALAKTWLDGALTRGESVAFAWVVLLAFLRLCTNPALFRRPLSTDEASDVVAGWLARPSALVVHPTDHHLDLIRGSLASLGTAANLVSDAHLAALALEHGAEVISFDTDFARFPGLRWRAPDPGRG
jgi:uncharacterized protein